MKLDILKTAKVRCMDSEGGAPVFATFEPALGADVKDKAASKELLDGGFAVKAGKGPVAPEVESEAERAVTVLSAKIEALEAEKKDVAALHDAEVPALGSALKAKGGDPDAVLKALADKT